MRRLAPLLVLVMAAALFAPAPAFAVDHVFQAPDVVVADPDGEFLVILKVTLGTGGGSFAHGYLEGRENCIDQLYADGFCMADFPEGHTLEVSLWGTLLDPVAPGRVYVEASVCSDQDVNYWTAELDVEPYTVPTDDETFGMVKARYRR